MSVHNLLNRLDKVKSTGKDRWKACCPAHRSTKQSLAIRDDNGKVLIHCFAEGCAIDDVLGAVGLTFADIMPERLGETKATKKPFYAGDVLQISRDEILVGYLIVQKMLNGTVNLNDKKRLLICATRLRHACEVANDNNGVVMAEVVKNQRVIERVANAY
ncbi:MAG: DNA primase [Methylotenera sp.]|uniref:DNA primase n=1 Tax=Methylotenera sp. TaxID=2051956 RepID=UPI000D47E01A|nr:DNA primase [Methylotenera sp.]PPC82610.1 MAG: DNA primase [Methylotenera sp.]